MKEFLCSKCESWISISTLVNSSLGWVFCKTFQTTKDVDNFVKMFLYFIISFSVHFQLNFLLFFLLKSWNLNFRFNENRFFFAWFSFLFWRLIVWFSQNSPWLILTEFLYFMIKFFSSYVGGLKKVSSTPCFVTSGS